MTEKRRKQVVYAIFALAVIWAAFNLPGKHRPVESVAPQVSEATPTIAAVAPEISSQPKHTLPDQWGRDPFARGSVQASAAPMEETPELRVAAVSVGGGKALAMINGKMVGQGDMIQGWRVKSISKAGVVLEANGRKITLNIGGE